MSKKSLEETKAQVFDSIALSVVLKARLDADELKPKLNVLLSHNPAEEELKIIHKLQALLDPPVGQPPRDAYLEFVPLFELLRNKFNDSAERISHSTSPQACGVLNYDIETPQNVLESFQSEATAHLQTVEQKLLHLESTPTDRPAMDAIFGAMHSLKGVFGFLGFAAAQELAHESENIIDQARKRRRGLLRDECDGLLHVVDILNELIQLLLNHSNNPKSPLPLIPDNYTVVREQIRQLAAIQASESSAASPAIKTIENNDARESTRAAIAALIRVPVGKLDLLIDTIGELVVTQSQIHQDPQVASFAGPRLYRNLGQLNKITRELQSLAMSLRMYPLRETFARITRIGRDLAHQVNKEVEISVQGADTEMDKNLIESMVDPLTHLIRNAVDHGIDMPAEREKCGKRRCGRINISARHQGGNIIVSVSDDGKGLNFNRILAKARATGLVSDATNLSEHQIRNLIFESGFSTAEKVTEVSGRGVGLDVVRRNVQSLGGRVEVTSSTGEGTTFELIMPLTLAIIDGLIARVGNERFIVPISSVLESIRPQKNHVSTVQGRGEIIEVRGAHLPLMRISEFANVTSSVTEPWNAIVMIVECGGERIGMMVDELLGQQQVVIKSLGERFKGLRGFSGGAVLGDGRVGLILDVPEVLAVCRSGTAVSGKIEAA